MFKNYFKTAWRFLIRNRTFSLINIIGLAVGTLCCLYIVLYVVNQYSYDKYYKDAKDIYLITSQMALGGRSGNTASSSPPIAPAMKNDFPEVKQFTRVVNTIGVKEHLLRYNDKSFYQKGMVFVDSTFFDVFNYHFVYGSPLGALTNPYCVVLMKPVAEKLFGNIDPVGKVIKIDDSYGNNSFKITGVIDNSLGQSSIQASMFISMSSGGIGNFVLTDHTWSGDNFVYAFVKLNPLANVAALEKKLPAFLKKYGENQLQELGMKKSLHLQPVEDIHTDTHYQNEISKTVSPSFLNLLLLIAGLIQLIACINFMNLSTARASKRAKEVGVRKVVGAEKGDLIKQFLGESFLLSLAAVLIAIPLLLITLPYLNRITQTNIQLSQLLNYKIWIGLLGIAFITGLFAGSYPALYLSAFKVVKVIKGNYTNHVSASTLRKSLVVFQFVISITLIAAIIIIYCQMTFIQNKNLGFDDNQKLIFTLNTQDAIKNAPAFVDDMHDLSGVKSISRANNYPSQFVFNDMQYYPPGGNMTTGQDIQFMLTDNYFVKTLDIKLISGRDFRLNDTGKVIINETAAKKLGLNPRTAPGTLLYSQRGPSDSDLTKVEIAGVMKDFNYNSLHNNVRPFMLMYDNNPGDLTDIIVSVNSNDYQSLLGKIGFLWKKDFPEIPFSYSFLNQDVQKQYETEITMAHIINSFTLIAIIISCLGLFGLAAFSAEQRRKEIGIRKTLGASVSGIVGLLSKDFIQLVIIAFVIAIPISWLMMNKWLQRFAYRIHITWWMLAMAGIIALVIALMTVGFQAMKAAVANPVEALRSE